MGGNQRLHVALEQADQGLERQIAIGFVVLCVRELVPVAPGFEELRPQHGDTLGSGPGRLEVGADRLTEGDGDRGEGLDDRLLGGVATGLDDHRLPTHQRTRAVTGVQRRHPEGPQPPDQLLARVVGIDRPQLGLDWRRRLELILVLDTARAVQHPLVQDSRQPDHRVSVDQAGRDDGCLVQWHSIGNTRGVEDAYKGDVAIGRDHQAITDRLAVHRVHDVAANRDLRGRQAGEEDC